MIKYIRFIIATLVSVFISSTSIVADYTYLDYDKLVFGNAGGFEVYPTDDGSYILQVLNLSGSDTQYISKAFSTEGKMVSVFPVTGNAYAQDDHMEMTNTDTFSDGVIPLIDGTDPFDTDMNVFVGEYKRNFMLLNEDTIAGYVISSGNEYESAPIYFQESYGTMYMGITSESKPVLSIYPSINNTVYWGINTDAPVEMITVSGDVKVEGTIMTTEGFGVMESTENDSDLHQYDGNNGSYGEYILADYTFELEGYVYTNIMVFGEINSTHEDVITGTWGHGRLRLYYYDYDASDWTPYVDPDNTDFALEYRSVRSTDGGSQDLISWQHIPFFTARLDIDPNSDGTTPNYKIELAYTSYSGGQYFPNRANINVIGLPSGNYSSVAVSSPVNSFDIGDLITLTTFAELDGNFLTSQFLSFGSGGAIVESGDTLIFSNGNSYLDFKAGSLGFGEYHKIDSLKITSDSTKYPFQVGSDSGNNLGFAPYDEFYAGPLATQNIQTLSSQSARTTTLNIESDIYIADNSSILTNGIVSPNIEIGDVLSNTSIMMNIEGNLLFTDDLEGELVQIHYLELDTDNYTSTDFSGGEHLRDDTLSFTLAEGSNWNLMIFAFLTVELEHRTENFIEIHVEGEEEHYSGRGTMYPDISRTNYGSLYRTFHLQGIQAGDYDVHLDVLCDLINGDAYQDVAIDENNDGVHYTYSGITNSNTGKRMDRHYTQGGAIAVIAIPSN